ncbi:hypothetical protein [Thiorhodovibrio frisius]|uniref:Uncharacterized protein n=1 Tax=Thiorhodovibrio frisius TaxID=631362 RepID=H8YW82_9GAMM|nr:hypothetical protein [Thiorhodovibrio frisius]EIC23685.1 hypothetical protein Thi970DRAFT_00179 [Thiorhodovibrio frisius]WPL20074.1 hypothetical protein Thiofri_00130 [Thiorhodovibrio frisius]
MGEGMRYAEDGAHDYPSEDFVHSRCHQADIDRLASIADINIAPGEEPNIDLKVVKDWYFATENLARVVSNTLQSIVPQTMNQLRYAGHHILKATTCSQSNKTEIQSNLIEAYKHCKRGYFDALDLFVYETNRIFQSRVADIDDPEKKQRIIQDLLDIIQNINAQRLSAETRIEYYSFLQEELVKAQTLFAEMNALTLPRVTALEMDLADALEDRERIETERNNYESENKKLVDKINRARAKTSNYLIVGLATVVATLALAIATLYQGYFTSKNIVAESSHTIKTDALSPLLNCTQPTEPKSENGHKKHSIAPHPDSEGFVSQPLP